MGLEDSREAIGAVSVLLRDKLQGNTSAAAVIVGRPEAGTAAAAAAGGPALNLFLYQIDHDGHLRNEPLDQGQRAPIWLVLRYLLTAYDEQQDSDSHKAHGLLGEGLITLQELNFLRPSVAALADNPEPLKISFDNADAELVSKIMQGTEDRYRFSAAFQVRPVMIASGMPPSYAPLVTTVGPGDAGAEVLPSLGPRLESLSPEHFQAGDEITLSGRDLTSEVDQICIGTECYPVTAAPAGQLKATVPANTTLSAGGYPVCAVKPLSSGRRLSSNTLLGHLIPTVTGATHAALLDDGSGNLHGDLTVTGIRLGGTNDAIYVAFYRDGAIALMLEVAGTSSQTSLTASVPEDDALSPGRYRVIVRVNGEQASNSPEVDWS